MKILVIDDQQSNLLAAQAQFADHDVTVAQSYDQGHELLAPEDQESWKVILHGFDLVLVDLMMPAGQRTQSSASRMEYVGQEMPVGIFLVLLAANNGAKQVLMLTDMDHHSHPASAALDPFMGQKLQICGAEVVLSNYNVIAQFKEDDLANPVDFSLWGKPGMVRAKNWRKVYESSFS